MYVVLRESLTALFRCFIFPQLRHYKNGDYCISAVDCSKKAGHKCRSIFALSISIFCDEFKTVIIYQHLNRVLYEIHF